MGCANPEGATGRNIARQIALRAGCPVTTSGMTVNRFCSSGLQTIAIAAQRVMTGEGDIFAAGGVESISCVQNEMNTHMLNDDWILAHKPELYWPMLQTAEYVAKTYGISREQQDQYGVRSQQRAAAARDAGRFNDEIAPMHDDDEGRRQGDRRGVDEGRHRRRRTRASAPTRPTRASRRSSRRSRAA